MAKYNLYNTDSIQNEFEKLFLANWISQERMQSLVCLWPRCSQICIIWFIEILKEKFRSIRWLRENMLESIVSSFLNRFLGDYFENFSSENLNVGILSGIATVENLHMTSTALQTMLNAPLKVTDGKLSKLHLQIPWTGTFKLLSFS